MARLFKTSASLSSPKFRSVATVVATAFAVAGCSVLGHGDVKSFYDIAKAAWSGNSRRVTLEEAAAVPYASMGIRLGGGPQVMIILAGDAGGRQLWTSAAHIAITTKDGRIVRTAGFDRNLGGFTPQDDTLARDWGGTTRWQADFPDLSLYSVFIVCRDLPAVDETIIILGSNIHTSRVDESCVSADSRLSWKFKNTYWLDPANGLVWRSVQHVHPRLDAIETEILRPPT